MSTIRNGSAKIMSETLRIAAALAVVAHPVHAASESQVSGDQRLK